MRNNIRLDSNGRESQNFTRNQFQRNRSGRRGDGPRDGLAEWRTMLVSKATVLLVILLVNTLGSQAAPTRCPKKICSAGHFVACDESAGVAQCKPCPKNQYQPDRNTNGDQCKTKKNCKVDGTITIHPGTSVSDAVCGCAEGYHLVHDFCAPNPNCQAGFGADGYGDCESCADKNMYSDTYNNRQKCQPFQNCADQMKCTVKKGTPTSNTICGENVVNNLQECQVTTQSAEDISQAYTSSVSTDVTTIIPRMPSSEAEHLSGGEIAGIIVCGVLLVVVVIAAISFFRWRYIRNQLFRQVNELCNDPTINGRGVQHIFDVVPRNLDIKYLQKFGEGLLRAAGYQENIKVKVKQIIEGNRDKSSQEQVHGMLLEWKQFVQSNQMHVSHVLDALTGCNIQELRDLASNICKYIKDVKQRLENVNTPTSQGSCIGNEVAAPLLDNPVGNNVNTQGNEQRETEV